MPKLDIIWVTIAELIKLLLLMKLRLVKLGNQP